MTARPGQIAALKAQLAAAEARSRQVVKPPLGRDGVRQVVAEECARLAGFAPEHIREDQDLTVGLGLHVFDRIELALALEDRLGLRELVGASGWVTVADVVRDAAGGE